MASTFHSSSSSSKFDVFLSFRGEDTRYTFTDHLFHALKRAAFDTFRDNDEIRKGHELNTELKSAITESRASIVVLSERYADSGWCLDELCFILEQKRKGNHFVLPVFYHVDPSDVRNQRQSFAIKVEEGVEGSKWTEENVNRWKAALTEVADLAGETVSGSENDVIARVVDTLDRELDLKQLSTPPYLTGVETRAELINSWLKDVQYSTNILAICGMGGSGKTTQARYIYNLNKQSFESSSFIEVGGKHGKQLDVMGLQRQLLTDVLGGKSVTISSEFQGTHKIEEVLKKKRVLIILDDIDDHDEVSTLLGTKTFNTQSKIIITTRLLDIDANVYKLEMLNKIESLELLSWHAFGSKIPLEGFKELAMQLAQYCGGNPLAIKVLGSSLRLRDEDLKERDSMTEIWRGKLNSLNSLQGDLDSKIQNVLQKSFDSLPYSSQKELFLHIACFFVGYYEVDVVRILENEWYAKSGMRTLVNKCLLSISSDGYLAMHQLLQDMGRTMVRNESKDPAERSRVWCSNESYHLLSKGDGSKKVEGLSLVSSELTTKGTQPLAALETGSLVKMKNLKLLKIVDMQLIRPYTNFPELRWLCWIKCDLKTIPSGLLTSRLVALKMNRGKLEKFEPPTVLPSLKILNLGLNQKLVSVYGFSLLPKLETLYLGGCSSLTHVCKTIGDLKSLDMLDLRGCTKLFEASLNKKYVNPRERLKAFFLYRGIQEQPLLSLPQSLKFLYLDYCDLPFNNDAGVVFHAQSFFMMSLKSNPFEYLPVNIDLKVLRVLDLASCPNLMSLPCLPSTLQELYISWCTSLERITFQSARFTLLKFAYDGCFKLSEIQGLFKLVPIAKIDEADLGDMHWIKAYQYHKVELVGDVITKGRSWHVQMLYEYGIRSTYLQGIKDESMMTYGYMSSSNFLSFHVPPLHPKKHRIQGLNVCCLYRSSGVDKDMWLLFTIIENRTKGLAWAYNPMVYCKPKVDEDVVWLSYWPVGNILDEGDEVDVRIFTEKGLIVSGCGVSVVYVDDEVGEEETCENYSGDEEVIGGDLYEFEVTTGRYYLCRRDLSESTFAWLKCLFGDNIHYTGWRKSRQSMHLVSPHLEISNNTIHKKIEVGVGSNSISEIDKIEKALSSITGVESVSVNKEIGRLYVTGRVALEEVATCVEKFEMAKIIYGYL